MSPSAKPPSFDCSENAIELALPGIALVGVLTVFSGYTAVYALNDIIDRRSDRARASTGYRKADGYLDESEARFLQVLEQRLGQP